MKQHIDDYHGHIVVHHDGSTQPVAVLVADQILAEGGE